MNIFIGVIALWASTLGIVALDKSVRANGSASSGDAPSFSEEPTWGVLVALCVVMNIATLPYYFYATRRSAVWGLIGCAAFVACLALMIVASVGAGLAGLR